MTVEDLRGLVIEAEKAQLYEEENKELKKELATRPSWGITSWIFVIGLCVGLII